MSKRKRKKIVYIMEATIEYPDYYSQVPLVSKPKRIKGHIDKLVNRRVRITIQEL